MSIAAWRGYGLVDKGLKRISSVDNVVFINQIETKYSVMLTLVHGSKTGVSPPSVRLGQSSNENRLGTVGGAGGMAFSS